MLSYYDTEYTHDTFCLESSFSRQFTLVYSKKNFAISLNTSVYKTIITCLKV